MPRANQYQWQALGNGKKPTNLSRGSSRSRKIGLRPKLIMN